MHTYFLLLLVFLLLAIYRSHPAAFRESGPPLLYAGTPQPVPQFYFTSKLIHQSRLKFPCIIHCLPDTNYLRNLLDISRLPSGLYLRRLTAGEFISTIKMVLMK
jgi:hypothetical protein